MATGGTIRDQLENVWRQTGVRPAELVETDLPDAIAHVWGWFIELNRKRRSGMSAPEPIGYQDIAAWATLTRREPTPFETSCLCELDDLIIQSAQKEK